jgi:hypothetical protein
MKDHVRALERNPIPHDIEKRESNAAVAQRELSIAIAHEAELMCRLEQAHTPEEAILKIVSTYVGRTYEGTRKVDTASEVLFREAAKQALGLVRTTPLNKRAHTRS